MRLSSLTCCLLAAPLFAQAPIEVGLRLSHDQVTYRGAQYGSMDANSVFHIQAADPSARTLPTLTFSLPAGEGRFVASLLYANSGSDLGITLPNNVSTVHQQSHLNTKDLVLDAGYLVPLVHTGKTDFSLSGGLRYARERVAGENRVYNSAGAFANGTSFSGETRTWGPRTGLQLRVGLGEGLSFTSGLGIALMQGTSQFGGAYSLSPSGQSTLATAPYGQRFSETDYDGDLALTWKKGIFETSFGIEHREYNSATFTGPYVAVVARF